MGNPCGVGFEAAHRDRSESPAVDVLHRLAHSEHVLTRYAQGLETAIAFGGDCPWAVVERPLRAAFRIDDCRVLRDDPFYNPVGGSRSGGLTAEHEVVGRRGQHRNGFEVFALGRPPDRQDGFHPGLLAVDGDAKQTPVSFGYRPESAVPRRRQPGDAAKVVGQGQLLHGGASGRGVDRIGGRRGGWRALSASGRKHEQHQKGARHGGEESTGRAPGASLRLTLDPRRGWHEPVQRPTNILGLTSEEMSAEARRRLDRGAGVADQIYAEAHRNGRFAPDAHGLRPDAAERWRAEFQFALPRIVRRVEEEHPAYPGSRTTKLVLATNDDLEIESVLIPMGPDKHTLCVSSQIGCKRACRFCETGRMGFLRDLRPEEIVGQVVLARTEVGASVTNIVFMGMGEALDNAESVLQALRVLNDNKGMAYGQQKITVCTVGNPKGLARLAELGWKRINISVSLNTAVDAQRDALMPINRTYPLPVLQDALIEHPRRKGFVYAVNYCLMPGINDQPNDAVAVARFVQPLGRTLVNVIPYNPGTEPLTRAPTDDEVDRFMGWLVDAGVAVRRRTTKGRSVMAACGQLGNVELRRTRRAERGG